MPQALRKSGVFLFAEVESFGSKPDITLSINAESFTVFVIGPAWSKEDAKAIIPHREHLPYVGLIPVTPQKAAGCLIDPPVSVPVAASAAPAETTAADPPEDPPGERFLLITLDQGFITSPKKEVSFEDPIANSSHPTFPSIIAPASHRF